MTGLALDYCVLATALDAAEAGYDTYVVKDATKGVSETTSQAALATLIVGSIASISIGFCNLNEWPSKAFWPHFLLLSFFLYTEHHDNIGVLYRLLNMIRDTCP